MPQPSRLLTGGEAIAALAAAAPESQPASQPATALLAGCWLRAAYRILLGLDLVPYLVVGTCSSLCKRTRRANLTSYFDGPANVLALVGIRMVSGDPGMSSC